MVTPAVIRDQADMVAQVSDEGGSVLDAAPKSPSKPYPVEFAWIPVDQLMVDERAQREYNPKRVQEYSDNGFRWSSFNAVMVGPKVNGIYPVVDGQHRVGLLKLEGIEEAPCLISDQHDIEEQATDFRIINDDRRAVGKLTLFKVRLTEGDEETIAIEQIVRDCGYSISYNNAYTPDTIVAVEALRWVYKAGGETGLHDTLSVLRAGWNNQQEAVSGLAIKGMHLFLSTYIDTLKSSILISDMHKDSATLITQRSKSRRVVTRVQPHRAFAAELYVMYNSGRRTNKLPPRSAVLAE